MVVLEVESGDREGERIPLAPTGPARLTLGRGVEADLRFGDSTMSRLQAELLHEHGAWHLVNHSKHGSFVGRRHLQGDGARRRLQPGDELVLGETRLRFLDTDPARRGGADTLTPETPTIAAPPSGAGYDSDGMFHSGQTLVSVPEDSDPDRSFVYLLGGLGAAGPSLRVKTRRLYFLAILCVLGLAGCIATGTLILLPTALARPGLMLAASAFALLPAIPYALLIKFLDRNDQIPWKNFVACLLWGGTVGCGLSLVLNTAGSRYLAMVFTPAEAWSLTAILIAPLVEEACKGLAVLVLFWILHDEFDNVLEGLILGAASGLGFALVENCIYNVRFLAEGSDTFAVMGTYRALVNALIGHPIYTAMTGAGLGLLRELPRGGVKRLLYPVLGLGTAIAMHVIWNAAAVYLGDVLGDPRGLLTLIVNAAVFGGAGVLFALAAYVFAASRERRVMVRYLAEEVRKGFVEPEELRSFHEPLGRVRFELEGLLRHGWRVYRHRKALRRTQVELAFRKWHLAKGDAPRGDTVDAYIRQARLKIRDLRNELNLLEGRRAGLEAV